MRLRLLYRGILLSLLLLLTAALYLQQQDPALLLETDALSEAKSLAQKNRWPEVRMLADFAAEHPQNGRRQTAMDLRQQADAKIADRWHNLRSFVRGAVSGKPVDGASLLGTISLDMFVIGDIRDLLVQGWNAAQGRETDGLVVGLSTVGLAATLTPQLHWAPALLKTLRRSRRLSPKLSRILARQLKAGEYRQTGQFIDSFANAARRMGPAGISGVMKWIDTPQAMTRLAKAASISRRDSYVVTRLSRGTLIPKISSDGSNIRLLAKSIRRGSRTGKLLIKTARTIPASLLWLLFALTLLALCQQALVSRNSRGLR
ncbi:MAG TPA: hypothetical protein ENI62_00990 [Gammaproteobacteria bacterium]|nr:hypothetical protein [Gammaproteobacteria bacterium]